MELQNYINSICEELESPHITKQRMRYLKSHLEEIIIFQKNNPYKTYVPSNLELYCDLNPHEPECRIYNV